MMSKCAGRYRTIPTAIDQLTMLSQAQNGLPSVSRGDILELKKKYIIEANVVELPSVVVVRVWLKTVLYENI